MRWRRQNVSEGQRFRKREPGGGVWEVVVIRKQGLSPPHAQIQRPGDPKTLKTLSLAALTDPQRFEPVGDAS